MTIGIICAVIVGLLALIQSARLWACQAVLATHRDALRLVRETVTARDTMITTVRLGIADAHAAAVRNDTDALVGALAQINERLKQDQ